MKLFIGRDLQEVSRMGAGALVTALRKAPGSHPFSVVLAGGATPKPLYELLAAEPYRSMLPWDRLHFFFGDERCVPPEHADSNFRMAFAALLSKVPIDAEQVHRIPGEQEPAEAARVYEVDLARYFGRRQPAFDWVYLGIGDDGHTASLFPGTAALAERTTWAAANRVDQLDAWRVTLTFPVLNQARTVAFLVSGSAKAPVLKEILEGSGEPRPPAALVRPETGDLRWFVDQPAASRLTESRGYAASTGTDH